MDAIECIQKRRSVRKYKDKAVEWDKIANILEAGRLAPSSGNIQNWKFVVVREYANRKKIAKACFDQEWVEEAPVLIVVTGEPEQGERFYGSRGERLYTVQNCAAAVENMLLAATGLELGSCWVGAFDESQIRTILQLPEDVMPYAVVTVGYADEEPLLPQKKRIEWLVGMEKYMARRKHPMRGYLSQVWPNIIKGAKEKVRKKVEKITK